MEDLIKALTILLRYGNPRNPTHCEHDVLTICGIDPRDVSDEDKKALQALGFERENDPADFEDDDDMEAYDPDDEDWFYSFRFGSA